MVRLLDSTSRGRGRVGLGQSSLVALAGVALTPLLWLFLRLEAELDITVAVPVQHFYIVSGVSILAALLAALVAVAVVQIALYRLLFLALGFLAMGVLFAVHGLSTPGVLPGIEGEYRGSVVGTSAFLSLAIPGLFFAISYAPGFSLLEKRLPFWPAGWIVILVAFVLGGYALAALLRSDLIASLSLSRAPASYLLASAGFLLLMYSAGRQWVSFRRSRLLTQRSLAVAFTLLAEAQIAMVIFPGWTLSWWTYHLLMLAAVAIALRALAIERVQGRSLRSIWRATLELEVGLGIEEIDADAVASLVAAVEVKDRETQGHNRRVAELSVKLGQALDLTVSDLRVVARAGLLHDVGKLGIPDAILHKAGPLDEAEWEVIRGHPQIGTQILTRSGKFKRELLGVLYHHERMDGSGYPHGLKGEAIPIEARIIAVADTFDVITSDRPYRGRRSQADAIAIIRAESGRHLDPDVVAALLEVVEEHRPVQGRVPTLTPRTAPA